MSAGEVWLPTKTIVQGLVESHDIDIEGGGTISAEIYKRVGISDMCSEITLGHVHCLD